MSNLSTLLPAGASGKTFEAVASAIITSKEPVVLDTAGTVSPIVETVVAPGAVGSLQTVSAYQTEHLWVSADPFNSNRWIVAWMDDVGTKDCYVRVITRSGTTLTMSSQNEFNGQGNASGISVAWDPVTENNFLCIYNNSSNYGSAVAGTVSGSAGSESFAYGSHLNAWMGGYGWGLYGQNLTALGTSGSWLVTWGKPGDLKAYGRILQLTSSKAISAGGSNTVLSSSAMYSYRSCTSAVEAGSSTAALACIIRSSAIKGIPLTISGTTISLGTEATIDSGTSYHADTWGYGEALVAANATTYILQCQKSSEDQMVLAIRLSGGSFSNGTPVTVSTTSGTRIGISNNLASPNRFVIQYDDAKPNVVVGTLDDTTITLGTPFVTASSVTTISSFTNIAQQNDDEAHCLGVFRSNAISGSALYGHAQCSSSGSTTSNNTALVGVADAGIASGATGTIVVRGGTVSEFGGIAAATGGTITTDGDYKVHTFTSSGTFQVTSITNNPVVDILQIAGGGGGGRRRGGGGGAGGYLYETGVSISAASYSVTVGAGGAGATSGNSSNGGNSSIGSLIAASVGGGGGGGNAHGANGGSGGGGQGMTAGINAGTATSGQGNDGIAGSNLSYGGGGGGSGGSGTTNAGGSGTANSITGSAVTRAGGGGAWNAGAAGSGGASAGGSGSSAASDATANTGSGGGGGGDDANGGIGGSGVVIVRYKFQGDQGIFSVGSNYYVQGDGTLNTSSNSPAVKVGKAISTTSLLLTGDS